MNLPAAQVAPEGFFVTHFFTVTDQEKSKDFYVRILGGKLIKPENPCYIKLANSWVVLRTPSTTRLSTTERFGWSWTTARRCI